MIQDNTEKIEVILVRNNTLISELASIFRDISTEIENKTSETIDIDMIRTLFCHFIIRIKFIHFKLLLRSKRNICI